MSWLEFIEKIVGHIAWPGAVITILLIIRHHLGGIFAALKSLKLPGGVELELHDRFKDLRVQGEAAKLPVPETLTAADSEQAKFLRMAEDFPQAAIMQAWIQLEKDIVDAAASYGQPVLAATPRPRLLMDALQDLRRGEVIDSATVEVIDHLRRIRNDVVHAKREGVTPGEALEFQEWAKAVTERLRLIKR